MADDLVPRPTHVQELIALHPREYALVSARMLAVASVVAIALVAHCALLVADPGAPAEPLLSGACLGRVVMAIPRPLAWTRIYSLHRGALREERVVRVAQRLLTALRDPLAKLNNRLQHLYNAWLLALLARLVWAFGRGWERSAFEQRVLRHVLACVTAQLATHIASACSVLLLIHRGDAGADSEQRERVERACPATFVDEALRRRLEERDSTCIVCFSELAVRDRVRSLPCGHTFHTECVDGWWRAPRGPMEAKCPTCSLSLPADDDSEANMGEEERLEVEWVRELRRRHPGIF